MRAVSLVVSAILTCLSARRALFLLAALLPGSSTRGDHADPSVVLLVAANEEAANLERLLGTIEHLDWPEDRLQVVLVDDASTDATWELMSRKAAEKENVHAIRLERRSGKGAALNAGLAASPDGDVVVVCDADLRLAPDYLRQLVPAFGDPKVGAAAAFVTSANPNASVVARYAALETWVHQLVTAAGKDRLGLNPATFAGSAYRRAALEAVGGFLADSAADDVGTSAKLTRAGWRTRFVRAARADHSLAERASDYWRQHVRWSQNVFNAGREGSAAGPRRLELAFAGIGYGDRLAFGAAVGLAGTRRMSPAVPASYACLRALEALVAVVKAGEARKLPAYLAAVAVVLPLDIASAVAGAVALRSASRSAWKRSFRSPISAAFE